MNNPFEILEVGADADDDSIKQAYLQKVKTYPPERYPQQFQQIRQAYETIKDRRSRLHYTLFNDVGIDFESWLNQALDTPLEVELKFNQFEQLVQASMDESVFLKAVVNHDDE